MVEQNEFGRLLVHSKYWRNNTLYRTKISGGPKLPDSFQNITMMLWITFLTFNLAKTGTKV